LAALARKYPFGGTRHCVFLVPFVIVLVSFGLTTISRAAAPWLAGAAMLVALAAPSFPGPSIKLRNQQRTLMERVVAQLRQSLPPGTVAVIDTQSVYPFRYYFCPQAPARFDANPREFLCGNFRVWHNPGPWMFTAGTFSADIAHAASDYGLQPATEILIFQTGWSVNAEVDLRQRLRLAGCDEKVGSGENIIACTTRVNRLFDPPGPDKLLLH
jgi:hypothetical protein